MLACRRPSPKEIQKLHFKIGNRYPWKQYVRTALFCDNQMSRYRYYNFILLAGSEEKYEKLYHIYSRLMYVIYECPREVVESQRNNKETIFNITFYFIYFYFVICRQHRKRIARSLGPTSTEMVLTMPGNIHTYTQNDKTLLDIWR